MKPWARYLLTGALGVLLGVGTAVWTVRSGPAGLDQAIGRWRSGTDFGSADQSVKTRAIVALRGSSRSPRARRATIWRAPTMPGVRSTAAAATG